MEASSWSLDPRADRTWPLGSRTPEQASVTIPQGITMDSESEVGRTAGKGKHMNIMERLGKAICGPEFSHCITVQFLYHALYTRRDTKWAGQANNPGRNHINRNNRLIISDNITPLSLSLFPSHILLSGFSRSLSPHSYRRPLLGPGLPRDPDIPPFLKGSLSPRWTIRIPPAQIMNFILSE